MPGDLQVTDGEPEGMPSETILNSTNQSRPSTWVRIGLILLGILLVPPTALICGFFCCSALTIGLGNFPISIGYGGNESVIDIIGMIISLYILFPLGIILGAWLIIYLLRSWWQHIASKQRIATSTGDNDETA